MRRVIGVWIAFCLLGLLNAVAFQSHEEMSRAARHEEAPAVRAATRSAPGGADSNERARRPGANSRADARLDAPFQPALERAGVVRSTVASSVRSALTANELDLLAHAVYGEARGEPYAGQVAVAAVILNRLEDPRFPDTVAQVIYEPGAFTAVADGQINLEPDETARAAARDAADGADPTGGAVYYYNPARTTNGWIWGRQVVTVIGRHRFAL